MPAKSIANLKPGTVRVLMKSDHQQIIIEVENKGNPLRKNKRINSSNVFIKSIIHVVAKAFKQEPVLVFLLQETLLNCTEEP